MLRWVSLLLPVILSAYDITTAYTFLMAKEEGLAVSSDDVDYPTHPRSGFKIEASYPLDGWNVLCSYRWFRSEGNSYLQANLPAPDDKNSIYAMWPLSLDIKEKYFVAGLSGSLWNNRFNRIDLSFGGDISIHNFNIYSFLGVIVAWDEQNFRVSYGYIDGNGIGMITEWNNRQDWYCVGPSLGLSPSCVLWSDVGSVIYIFAKSNLALSCSRADTLMKFYNDSKPPTKNTIPILRYSDVVFYVAPMMEIFLGICWEFDSISSIKTSLGWTQEIWFDHNHMLGIYKYPYSIGLYSMQGLNVSVGVGY